MGSTRSALREQISILRPCLEAEAEWTDEYQRLVAGDDTVSPAARFRYRHSDIKATIKQEANGKCAYCESKISHEHPGETDHIRPSSKHPHLVVQWENLTYVCTECNREKLDYDSDEEPLLNPYSDSPEEHITFYGPMELPRPGDAAGYRTIGILKLDRSALFDRRREKIVELQRLIDLWAKQRDGPTKELLKEEALTHAQADREFSAAGRAFLHQSVGW